MRVVTHTLAAQSDKQKNRRGSPKRNGASGGTAPEALHTHTLHIVVGIFIFKKRTPRRTEKKTQQIPVENGNTTIKCTAQILRFFIRWLGFN